MEMRVFGRAGMRLISPDPRQSRTQLSHVSRNEVGQRLNHQTEHKGFDQWLRVE